MLHYREAHIGSLREIFAGQRGGPETRRRGRT
jgi:hypothetical protein